MTPIESAEAAPSAQYVELALTIADQAQAIAEGTVIGPKWSAARRLRENAARLEAWTEDDRGN